MTMRQHTRGYRQRHRNACAAALILVGLAANCPGADSSDRKGPEILTNSIGMTFARITIGPDQTNDAAVIAALKRRLRATGGYYLGVYEVRQADFATVLGRNPSVFAESGKLRSRVEGVATDDLPVDSVSWNDAVAFCERLSSLKEERRAGRRYRLPSSDEWEYAARAGSGQTWCFGDDRSKLDEHAWFGFDRCGQRTHVVGGKKANGFGLHDMYGNVWEWCQDADATDAAKETDPSAPPSRIIRGGGWMSEPRRCNSVYAQSDPPGVGDPDTGFRVVMEAGGE